MLLVKSSVTTVKRKLLYLFDKNGVMVRKAGWYKLSNETQVHVGAKGYVTNKFDSKAGRFYKYDYGKNKWVLLKMSTYKIGKNTYCFDSKGRLIRKQIVGNARTGYYYVDSTGCKVTSKEIQTAVNLVIKNTNSAMTREQKLYACFMRIRKYPYARDYVTITADASQFSGLALQAMNSGTANCYKYASAFACVATVLGYDARVICGQMPAYYGSGLTDHGWTELWDSRSKSWKLYDSCLQRAIYYNWKIADYFPGESPVDKTAQLTVANGKVTWKWVK